ncbi:heme oxygenase [Actinoplanes lutulentus]|uniref:Heme oxygenase n=1 Tax=Actinoplanes lutulentus TaxID=1287878 RepID=A0A327Z0P2_9ACTN|nr:biliverdin-producing heme oxygenase [Actinoplanes lutulentus]MBB2944630.1 heme oxygenase [Actinoplanes lutulentus]RAK27164.1 heme oxygenase [Actinoplanes lutulentus]
MTGFAARIRRATMVEHREAETRTFISRLMAGTIPVAGFAELTSQYLVIYRELEAAAEAMRNDPVAGAFADPALFRVPALEADLAHLHGAGWESTVVPVEATQGYAQRLREKCRTSPEHFIAHHYVRYLGDLSGGQLIGRTLSDKYGLPPAATNFYRFEQIPDAKAYKTAYRQQLDALDLPEERLEVILAEARQAFAFNGAIFTELGTAWPEDVPAAA